MKSWLTTIIVLLCLIDTAFSQQYAISLDDRVFHAGEPVNFVLVAVNQNDSTAPVFPDEISCTLVTQGDEQRVLAKQHLSIVADKDANRPLNQAYSLDLPAGIEGEVIVSFDQLDIPRIIVSAKIVKNNFKDVALARKQETYPTLDSMGTLYQSYLKNTSAYEPMYFMVGTKPENSKFQISFKYRFFDSSSTLAKHYPWIRGLHFAYTQTSYWDLEASSAPFDDTSYKPELFWQSKNFLDNEVGLLKGIFFQGGVQHESNGQADLLSRSANYIYAKPIFIFYDQDSDYGFMISSKIWNWIGNDDETNPDLEDYRGYFEIETKLGKADSFVGGALFRWAEQGASIQLDLSYPIHNIFNNIIDVYFYAQYVDMLAESLLDYDERNQAFRLGFAIIR